MCQRVRLLRKPFHQHERPFAVANLQALRTLIKFYLNRFLNHVKGRFVSNKKQKISDCRRAVCTLRCRQQIFIFDDVYLNALFCSTDLNSLQSSY